MIKKQQIWFIAKSSNHKITENFIKKWIVLFKINKNISKLTIHIVYLLNCDWHSQLWQDQYLV
jgi:hypothetical protein